MDETPGRGRPRSETARRAVLDAALRLCQDGGYQALTMKGIAESAGVGRQTVYRWWPAKQDVLLDALRDLGLRKAEHLDPDSGDTLRDVRTLLDATFVLTRKLTGKALIGLMADAQHDPDLSQRLQSTVIGPRRQALRALLARGVQRGELSGEDGALDLAVDFAFGAMWYRLISHHAPVDARLAEQVTSALAKLLSADEAAGARTTTTPDASTGAATSANEQVSVQAKEQAPVSAATPAAPTAG
ncbi:TetR/AcrR family transcriptional regulator C-terminal ligand-binding domain-containing protein [Streptomyces sp. NPDC008139]|uniref:TetR/AcrR family transcriptional regulator n=1 Tax=Streptomyces sp. NPDC008139 TaxID=3364814 RepID=UPI0036EECE79